MSNRIVLITGGTGGLGRAVVDAFHLSGDTVVSASRSAPGVSGPVVHIQADLTTGPGARELITDVMRRFHRLDVLIHVMGGFAGGEPVHQTDDATWERMLNLNLRSAFLLFREALPPMIAARTGRIVAVGSRAGVQPAAGLSAYSISKAGLHALVQTVALEVKDFGINANVVLPSTIDTEANRSWGTPEQVATWVKPSSIADVIVWLCSDAASDINGALIPVYGRA
jgi:NAD(P)-dependent dehydrogenase (short-subunit alcohol dehydrogenase family)